MLNKRGAADVDAIVWIAVLIIIFFGAILFFLAVLFFPTQKHLFNLSASAFLFATLAHFYLPLSI